MSLFNSFILSLFLLISCQHQSNTKNIDIKTDSSSLIQSYTSSSNSAYHVYKPNHKQKLKLLIFLDPKGNGIFPIQCYQSIFKNSNIALIGIDAIKNGIDLNEALVHLKSTLSQLYQQEWADTSQIALCGFSGGAKYAQILATQIPTISKVIYIGATNIPLEPKAQITYLAMAGTQDMNYSDIIDQYLIHQSKNHLIKIYNGKHQWPDSNTFKSVISFINNNYTERFAISNNEKSILQKEKIYKQGINNDFGNITLDKWQLKINEFNLKKSNDSTGMYNRLLGYISLACYSYTNQAIAQKNKDMAQYFISIYEMADPLNEDMLKMKQMITQF